MLLKVEGLVKPQWKFSPGNTQIGDGFSRNPEDRDEVRGESEGKAHMPRTLAEAFAASTGTTLEGQLLSDDAEQFTQQFENSVRASTCSTDTSECPNAFDKPESLIAVLDLGRSDLGACYAARTTKSGSHTPAVLLLPRVGDLLDSDALQGYTVMGKNIRLTCEVVIQPPLVSALGGRRWLE
eukprot:6164993-Heterocapsa_arctica.AAC.1